MIYLIDDKKIRQKDFGWIEEKFTQYSSQLNPLYNIDDVAKIGENLYNNGNIILYHESFLDFTDDKDKAVKQRNKLLEKAESDTGLFVVFFSGSQSSRFLKGNMALLPVAILYQNLEILIQQNNTGSGNLKYLLFGVNPEIEEELNEKLTRVSRDIEESSVEISGTNLFIRPASRYIQNAIKGATEEKIFNDISDEKLSERISEWLNETEYDNIFLPLCFGQTLSDYNGLRLATHIRCTPTKNQLKRIFIYGFVGLDYLLEQEYFNILKTKNIQLVSYSKKAFGTAANTYLDSFKPEELPKEIKKLKLNPPLNYSDSHSIANEWAIHQWAKTIGCDESEELKKVFQNVQYNLYFKYLRTIQPITKLDVISDTKLKIDYKGKSKVLLIDDEAEKGWYEIFAFLLGDLNNIYTDYLGVDFKSLSSDEIIEKSIDKIFTDDIDVVILDFRLNPSDFENDNTEEITSIKLLKRIKKRNPGIQVIAFSATNKVWNLQALQGAEVDGFIFKDTNENFHLTIESLIPKVTSSIRKSSWLKPIWNKTTSVIDHLENQRKKHILDKDFTGAISTFLQLGFDSLINCNKSFPFDSAFMYYFLILEAISKQMINEETPHEINYTNKYRESKKGYKFQFRTNYEFLKDFEGNEYMQVATGGDLISSNKRIPYNPKFHNLISLAGIHDINPITIVDLRNKFNHPNLIDQRVIAVIEKNNIDKIFEVCTILLKNL
jgi:CheY-like chemotaxis protein